VVIQLAIPSGVAVVLTVRPEICCEFLTTPTERLVTKPNG
jgi:hypothetical protein